MATVADVLTDVSRARKTGLLSLSLRNDNNLFKLYFLEGEIYHLTCGGKQDTDCLQNCGSSEFVSCFFLADFKLEYKKPALLPSTAEIIALFAQRTDAIEVKPAAGRATIAGMDAEMNLHFARIREGLKVALIRQIGPAGNKVFTRIVDEKWRVASPRRADLQQLIALLQGEIDDAENRNQFRSEAEKLISS
jgi:hypothetical protein